MARKKIVYAVTPDGERRKVTGENGRYWVCGGVQVRKARAVIEEETEKPKEKKPNVIDQEARDAEE